MNEPQFLAVLQKKNYFGECRFWFYSPNMTLNIGVCIVKKKIAVMLRPSASQVDVCSAYTLRLLNNYKTYCVYYPQETLKPNWSHNIRKLCI